MATDFDQHSQRLMALRSTEQPGARCSIIPNEILLPESRIRVDLRYPGERSSLRGAANVDGVRGQVRATRKGRTLTWSGADGLPPGQHVFHLTDVVSASGKVVAAGGSIPFRVVNSSAPVSSTLRIEHFVRLRVDGYQTARLSSDEAADGDYIDVFKGSHRKTDAPLELAYDHRGRPVDLPKLRDAMKRRRSRALGKTHPTLSRIFETKPGRRQPIAVWFEADTNDELAERPERLTKKDEKRYEAEALQQQEATARQHDRLAEIGIDVRGISTTAPVVYAVANEEDVARIARRRDVIGVFYFDETGVDDLDESIAVHRSDSSIALGADGNGVKTAVWESHPDDTSELVIDDQYLAAGFSSTSHARNVTGIIKNTDDGPDGHAPQASIHSANSTSTDALDWAIGDKRCRVLNQSFHRLAEATDGVMSFDDIYKDWLALRYPWPLMVHAAGNYFDEGSETDPPEDEFVNHKGYNTISVGNHNDDASGMNTSNSVFSVFRNPPSAHGDRELPEIAANGDLVTAADTTFTGTSQASPAVAGIGAQLHSTHSSLPTWPEGARAVLLAGARRNVVDSTWWADVSAGLDASDGSGSAHALESHRIAKRRVSKDNAAVRRGWNASHLTTSDFHATSRFAKFDYRIKVPSFFLGPRTVKVALTWTSTIDTENGGPVDSRLAVDLDLHVVDSSGATVAFSVSWDNSYEIAEFVGQRGEEYRIRIRRFSGTDPTYHGIAWTVTGGFWDLFDLLQLDATALAKVDLVKTFG